jgi:hypothetical protein
MENLSGYIATDVVGLTVGLLLRVWEPKAKVY